MPDEQMIARVYKVLRNDGLSIGEIRSLIVARKNLRDEFAVAAMNGIMSAWGQHDITSFSEIAHDAYSLADAMMEARR